MPRGLSPYNEELLDNILKEGDAILDGSYDKFNQRMLIDFLCKCGAKTNKRFEMLNVHRLPYCKECSVKEMIVKQKKTCMDKYGVENAGMVPEKIEKIKETCLKKYGGHPKTNKEVQEKWKETCIQKYGGHPNQNKEVQAKSEATSYHYKEYMMPSGNIVKYQGYENLALNELIHIYNEEDIITGRTNIPTIDYYIGEIKHVYFPDLFIKFENKIIEVKSDWTIQLKRGNIEEKALATIKAGYKYEIWVYNDKKVKVDTKIY